MKANKIDINQTEIVKSLREMGYSVRSIAELKKACDLIVSDGYRIELFEVKNPEYCRGIEGMSQEEREQFFTQGEAEFADQFRVWIVINADEVHHIFIR